MKRSIETIDYEELLYSVIDLETTIRNRGEDSIGDLEASPFHPDNEIFLSGWTALKKIRNSSTPLKCITDKNSKHLAKGSLNIVCLLVGQNIKFDLLYLLVYHYEETMQFFKAGGRIWDTMQAEYLLSNQQEQFAPLGNKYKIDDSGEKELIKEGLAVKYGGHDKDDRIAEYWKQGIDTPDIPFNELNEYLIGDLTNTDTVFRGQYDLCLQRGDAFLNLVTTQMRAMVATTIMEFNGMKIDVETLMVERKELKNQVDQLEFVLKGHQHAHFQSFTDIDIPLDSINPGSTKQKSSMFFGGEFKFRAQMPIRDDEGGLTYYKGGMKAGEVRTRYEEIILELPRTNLVTDKLVETSLGYQVDDDVITKHVLPRVQEDMKKFTEALLEYSTLKKDLSTYYDGLLKLIWPTDSCLHGSLNHCSTGTGRTSSSKPNMQNIP